MPRASRDELPVERIDAYEGRMTQMGDYNMAFEKMPAEFPPHELFRGLPDDHCPCEHWGYVFKGAIKFTYTDGSEEVFRAGDAYYATPGHLPTVLEDVELVEFSPKGAFDAHGAGRAQRRSRRGRLMSTRTRTFAIEAVARTLDRRGAQALADVLADDVEWTEVDQRTPPASPAHYRGREQILELFGEAERRGIRPSIDDGFVAGDRAALTLRCTYPSGETVLGNALCELRDGKIVRWSAVQAWDG